MSSHAAKLIFVAVFATLSVFAGQSVGAEKIPPDSAVKAPGKLPWRLTETGPARAPVSVFPTALKPGEDFLTEEIKNADGRVVTYSERIPSSSPFLRNFLLPPIINGRTVTDATQRTGNPDDPLDPGTLSFTAYNADQTIYAAGISNWLLTHGYVDPTAEIAMPDFFPLGFTEVFYGVDLAELLDAGKAFVDSYPLGTIFTIDAFGRVPELPYYAFSSTPVATALGGYVGTPLAPGTQVQYVAFHTAAVAVPEPSTLALIMVSALGYRWRRRRTVDSHLI